jgi:predicted MPP superfamily phosphohydrolase
MPLFIKILLLLWLVNFAPPLLAYLLEERWAAAMDRGRTLRDGRPLFGDHKTVRGVVGSLAMGALAGPCFGFLWWDGPVVSLLSVLGDLLSSFIKRRMGLPDGSVAPGLDQVFEGALPLLYLSPAYAIGLWTSVGVVALFGLVAYAGSLFHKNLLLRRPHGDYGRRRLTLRVRLRELRACEIASHPLHRFLNFEDAVYYHFFMKNVFRVLGIYQRGVQNALDIGVNRVSLSFETLPQAFDAYQILFMSDLHLDGLDGLAGRVERLIDPLETDLCILGGDFRMEMSGPSGEALSRMAQVTHSIHAKDGIYAILGNHDCLEMIPALEGQGIRVLLNEARPVDRSGSRIWIAGCDDPHHYRCHDLDQAFSEIPPNAFSIFVAHSQEIYREAEGFGAQLYLCGHTHGGQIRIPKIGPVFTHSRAPRRLGYGPWHYGAMAGYTSSGVGVSGVPVRFLTTGEVVHLTLKKRAGNHLGGPPGG